MDIMNYSCSTSASYEFNSTYPSEGWTVAPSAIYIQDGFNIILNPYPVSLYHLNLPVLNVLPDDPMQNDNFDRCLKEAINRFREVSNTQEVDLTKAGKFLAALRLFCNKTSITPYIFFTNFAVKTRLKINEKEFTLDYDYEDPDAVFVLFDAEESLIVKDCALDKIAETLRLF